MEVLTYLLIAIAAYGLLELIGFIDWPEVKGVDKEIPIIRRLVPAGLGIVWPLLLVFCVAYSVKYIYSDKEEEAPSEDPSE